MVTRDSYIPLIKFLDYSFKEIYVSNSVGLPKNHQLCKLNRFPKLFSELVKHIYNYDYSLMCCLSAGKDQHRDVSVSPKPKHMHTNRLHVQVYIHIFIHTWEHMSVHILRYVLTHIMHVHTCTNTEIYGF